MTDFIIVTTKLMCGCVPFGLDECRALTDDHYRRYQERLPSINPLCVLDKYFAYRKRQLRLINFSKRRKVAETTDKYSNIKIRRTIVYLKHPKYMVNTYDG